VSAFAAIFLLATLGGSPETPAQERGSMGTRTLSRSVQATWIVRGKPDEPWELELLVLWRGNTGWFMREGAGETTGGSMGGSGREGDRGTAVATLSFGEVELKLEFDGNTQVARLHGHEVSLGPDNVMLVDEVDGPAGPQIAGTAKVDAQVGEEPSGDIEVIIRGHPELYDFLRCEIPGPDAAIQPMMDELCARMRPR
jgi:hypothetical protein